MSQVPLNPTQCAIMHGEVNWHLKASNSLVPKGSISAQDPLQYMNSQLVFKVL